MNKRIAATVAGTALAAPLLLTLGAPAAHADIEKRGTCGAGAFWELNVDRENGGFEVDVDLDTQRAGDKYRIRFFHDGDRVSKVIRFTDNEGEVDHDIFRRDTAGKDTFRFRAKNLTTGQACGGKIVTR